MFKKKDKGKYKDKLIARSEEAKTVRKIVAIIIISLVLILLVGGISGYMYVKSALNPVDPDSKKEVNVTIPMGSSTSSIASILDEKGIIKDARVFRFYIKFQNESDFQAGDYEFSPSMTLDEIIDSLKKGKVMEEAIYKVTIPEGKTIDQIAQIYAKKLPIKKEEFLSKVNDPDYVSKLIDKYPEVLSEEILNPDIKTPLEGYLFAATYKFYQEEPSATTIIEKMLKKTVAVVSPYLDEISTRDFTVHEMITMASLVENEARTKDQRKKIAGVFYNRLHAEMPLQTDPTVLYALGKHKDKVLLKDLEIESPYNTYQIDTLPVGPISNFAENSLKATLEPEESDYKYFLHDDEGNIHYAKTHDEHLKLKEQYIE
ncbi:endolytic transglycosylase MltG [Lentibacillus sp. Marseille-P4043]|uniref:endolytic transglycosylase MltG n=1 Tax=Lentibacillus sp. Marseille-P4043 TaxID=2040293 RepID=UPI000D0B51DE|nr:endolytic transglycosylase MltG [Lentibacillus sp. Marseille-P4043]